MNTSNAPIIILAGGSLAVALYASSQMGQSPASSPYTNANDTTNSPTAYSNGGGHSTYLWNRGYRPSTTMTDGYVAPDGRTVTESEALSETGYSSSAESESTSRGGFGESGEGHGGGGGEGGGGE